MTLCWPRSKVKVTVHIVSTWVVNALKSLNLIEFQYNCTHMYLSLGAWGIFKLGQLDLFSRSQETIFKNGRKPVYQKGLFCCAKRCAVSIKWSIKTILHKIGHCDLILGSKCHFITTIEMLPIPRWLELITLYYTEVIYGHGKFYGWPCIDQGQGHSAHWVNLGCKHSNIFKIDWIPI